MMLDLDVSEKKLAKYLVINEQESGPFSPIFEPHPELVTMTPEQEELESAMQIGNSFCRFRRKRKFNQQITNGSTSPVIVAEGDSWFQFPILIDDVVDHLSDKYLVWCVSAAGDTAQNMVFGQEGKGKREYIKALRKQKNRVKAFLFSGAGNDIIGEDQNGVPVLTSLLKEFHQGGDAASHINHAVFGEKLTFLKRAYTEVITQVRSESGLENLPIVLHGYDYAIPGNKGDANDPRDPSYAAKDQWLGKPLADKRIRNKDLQRDIIRFLINGLYDMLNDLQRTHSGIHVVDVRKTLPEITDWNDEIHGTSGGFAKVAKKFRTTLKNVVVPD